MKRESAMMKDIRAAINRARDADGNFRARVVRNSVGFDESNKVRYGQPGSPDLWGILRGGRCFALEIKTATGRLSDQQRAWWTAFYAWGGLGGVASSVDEAMALLTEAERATLR